ncbi:hypothetical protein CSB20_09320 [bacterium DOLZORAL124_64_63]|nr:MAG: hypothetical protein CSB20_09320 [bacterium DOLZORAL124_64_63]
MRDNFTIIETFTSSIEAEMAEKLLRSADIDACIETENPSGVIPPLDLTGGVRLLVPSEALEKARTMLAGAERRNTASPWTCPDCGEAIEAGFDTCWQCGAAMPAAR